MVTVFASVNLPLHHKVQKFSSGTGSPGWSWKKGRKMVVVCSSNMLTNWENIGCSIPFYNIVLLIPTALADTAS